MARVTVEDCLKVVTNRFSLVHAAAARARQLEQGAVRLFESRNKEVVHGLREIASGKISVVPESDQRDPAVYGY